MFTLFCILLYLLMLSPIIGWGFKWKLQSTMTSRYTLRFTCWGLFHNKNRIQYLRLIISISHSILLQVTRTNSFFMKRVNEPQSLWVAADLSLVQAAHILNGGASIVTRYSLERYLSMRLSSSPGQFSWVYGIPQGNLNVWLLFLRESDNSWDFYIIINIAAAA